MTLIKSISGIRGTIGGEVGENLTPIDIVKFTIAYTRFIAGKNNAKRLRIVVGRDMVLNSRLSTSHSMLSKYDAIIFTRAGSPTNIIISEICSGRR